MKIPKAKKQLPRIKYLLLFLVFLFLPTQLGKHFWPNFSFIFSLKIDYLSPTIYFWDILVLITGAVLIFTTKFSIKKKSVYILGLFLSSQIISFFSATNIGASLVQLEQFTVAAFFGLIVASLNWNTCKKIFFPALLIGCLAESLLAICQFFLSHSVGFWIFGERNFSLANPTIAKFDFLGMVFLRPYGTFSHPNVFAGFMIVSLPLLVYFLSTSWKLPFPYPEVKEEQVFKILFSKKARDHFIRHKLKNFIFSIGLILLPSLALVLSFSRSAILLFLLQLGIYLRKNFIIFIFLITALGPILYVRFDSTFNFDNLSLIRREQLAKVAWDYFQTKPLLGVGLNNFINQTAYNSSVAGPNRFLQPVHNIYLLSLSETGLIGFLGLMILISYPIRGLILKRQDTFAKVLLICWGSILFLGVFDHYFLTLPQGYRMLFCIWGLSMVVLKQK